MPRQVGPLVIDGEGLACRGVLARHLVLPGDAADTARALGILRRLSADMPVSVMYQYFPAYRAVGHPLLGRRLWQDECADAASILAAMRFRDGWCQDYT